MEIFGSDKFDTNPLLADVLCVYNTYGLQYFGKYNVDARMQCIVGF